MIGVNFIFGSNVVGTAVVTVFCLCHLSWLCVGRKKKWFFFYVFTWEKKRHEAKEIVEWKTAIIVSGGRATCMYVLYRM